MSHNYWLNGKKGYLENYNLTNAELKYVLDVVPNEELDFKVLYISGNQITKLDFLPLYLPNLEWIFCIDNPIPESDLMEFKTNNPNINIVYSKE
jgi:hypothetical protein